MANPPLDEAFFEDSLKGRLKFIGLFKLSPKNLYQQELNI
jgi:hypothetical protein